MVSISTHRRPSEIDLTTQMARSDADCLGLEAGAESANGLDFDFQSGRDLSTCTLEVLQR